MNRNRLVCEGGSSFFKLLSLKFEVFVKKGSSNTMVGACIIFSTSWPVQLSVNNKKKGLINSFSFFCVFSPCYISLILYYES